MLAIVESYRAGLLTSKYWIQNLIAGLIVGVVALPLAMAFAIASGVKPEQGLYTAIIAALIVGIFGGSRVQIAGPTGAFVIILANITARYGIDGLQIATLFAGFILVFMGFLKLGAVIKFIPDPVIVGFTGGIGVIIFVGEWNDFFGLSVHIPLNAPFYLKLLSLIRAFPHLDWPTVGLASLSLLLIIITPKFLKRIPGPLIAMVVATVLQTLFHFKSVATIGSTFGGITQTLPQFHLPQIQLEYAFNLIGPAFTIALLGAIESLLSATAADGMSATRHNSNQELIGQGLANIFSPLFGGFAATGAIARTATNIRNGGNSPLAAIVHSIFLILVIVLLAPYASDIPLCTLAAILFVVAYNMSDIPHFIHMIKHAPSYDLLVLITTFLLTIFTDLVVAVNVGVILAMLLFVRRMGQFVAIEQQDHETLKNELSDIILPKDTVVYTIQGPFFFAAAEKLERAFMITHSDPKNIVFRLKDVPFMDITGLQTFIEIIEEFHKRHINVYLCEANSKVKKKLMNIGVRHWIKGGRIFLTLKDTIKKLQN
ncbi:sodium-independent anion transporter [Legionella qingyii]|uniref:STAS domain-containing protein n=1 Tax=Legionella qingyii TaxID=2184757 RepID=A0A317U4Y3_9GAMM|nr:SulP family inorganic anion transporter [Legionella qingyii]PWY57063.1 sodium-independent anion transporter [Legionella qingyii]RUR26406.1 STAS domain-containing protein [Legionella qingyii]RUR27426.1 STAS domain-containing protein [Legionella qingyii]